MSAKWANRQEVDINSKSKGPKERPSRQLFFHWIFEQPPAHQGIGSRVVTWLLDLCRWIAFFGWFSSLQLSLKRENLGRSTLCRRPPKIFFLSALFRLVRLILDYSHSSRTLFFWQEAGLFSFSWCQGSIPHGIPIHHLWQMLFSPFNIRVYSLRIYTMTPLRSKETTTTTVIKNNNNY